MNPRQLLLVALLLAVPGTSIGAQAKNAEELWKALEKLPAAEREKKLIEGTKVEGELLWYTNTGTDNAHSYIRAFKKAYPFINAKVYRGKSRMITDKFLTEATAGVFLADVIKTSTNLLPPLFKENLLGRYDSPIKSSYPAHSKGSLWANLNYAFRVFGFNSNRVSRQEAPKTWEGLLHPRWKGKILFDESSQEEVVAAALFHDFLLSDAGQKLIAEEGRVVSNPKMEPIYPRMKELQQLLGTPRVQIDTPEEAPRFYKESLEILDEVVLKRRR